MVIETFLFLSALIISYPWWPSISDYFKKLLK